MLGVVPLDSPPKALTLDPLRVYDVPTPMLTLALAPIAGATITPLTIPNATLGAHLGLFAGFLLRLAASDILPEAHTPSRATGWTLTVTALGPLFMWGVIGLTD
ncbi:zinc transporter ZupT [Nonomuraea thailandensis]|uniref:Zinc transporter ZupT n=1 Tax=Nonomuraea thailandensis TaxID=1188745 RepID=A0A9X2GWT2_9ACTN|nr:hypothetical protein [Nonomuraea thailandensis]MCP2365292.1 zinc transporter ZupT [Nonomuraea thailandensis]